MLFHYFILPNFLHNMSHARVWRQVRAFFKVQCTQFDQSVHAILQTFLKSRYFKSVRTKDITKSNNKYVRLRKLKKRGRQGSGNKKGGEMLIRRAFSHFFGMLSECGAITVVARSNSDFKSLVQNGVFLSQFLGNDYVHMWTSTCVMEVSLVLTFFFYWKPL